MYRLKKVERKNVKKIREPLHLPYWKTSWLVIAYEKGERI